MTERRVHRPIPLALTMLIALFSALVALALSGGHHMDMTANAATVHHQHATVDRSFALQRTSAGCGRSTSRGRGSPSSASTTKSPDTPAPWHGS